MALSSFFLLSCSLLAYTDTAVPSNAFRVDADADWDMDMDDIWVASPSDIAYMNMGLLIDDRTLMNIDDFGDLKRDGLLRYILHGLIAIRDPFGDPDLASSSDAALSSLEDAQDVSDLEEDPIDTIPMDAPVRSARSVSTSDDYVNVPRYDASISSQEYTFLFPPEYANSFYIDSRSRLFNVLTNTIRDRLADGSFNPYAQIGRLVYPTPCLDNNLYTVSEYGSPNCVRRYY